MTDVINFFQTLFIPKNLAPLHISKQESDLATLLKREAQKLAAKADEEMSSGRTTQTLATETGDAGRKRAFAKIAVWHHHRAAEKYHLAAEKFDEAGKIQIGKSKAFNSMTKEMTRRAVESEATLSLLEDLLKQN